MSDEIVVRGPERVTAAYEHVGRMVGREHGGSTAVVLLNGVLATCLRHEELETGEAIATSKALTEELCGDSLAIAAAAELGLVRSLCLANWLSDNWAFITERVGDALADPPPADTAEESAYRAVAGQMTLTVDTDHRVARAVLAGAAAVARLRRHTRSDVQGSTEDQIEAMAQTDPVIAAAWDELDEADRRGPGTWVIHNWDEICCAAEELTELNTTAARRMLAEQRMEILEREMGTDAPLEKVKVPYMYRQEVTMVERYRRAGEQFALNRGYNAVECVYAGVCAETWYRGEAGDSAMGSLPGVQLEVICGDPLASRAAAELGTIEALRYMNWLRGNWEEIDKLAAKVEIDRWRKREDALSRAAMELASSTPVSTAVMLYTGAVAALRYNHPGLRDRIDEEITRAEADDPLLALARRGVSDADRIRQLWWVEANWDEIVSAAADLVHAEENAACVATSDQIELITRHEVRHWLRTTFPDKVLADDPGCAYLEAAAVVAVKYPDVSANDAEMRIYVRIDDAVRATDAENVLTDDARAQLREAARTWWAPLAEALND